MLEVDKNGGNKLILMYGKAVEWRYDNGVSCFVIGFYQPVFIHSFTHPFILLANSISLNVQL